MTSSFTREDKDKLARKRAANPTLSGAAAGAAGGALVANVGGLAMRNASQRKVFDPRTNEYSWVNRDNVTPRRARVGRVGAKVGSKAIPLTLAAGGLNAVAAANGIQMSHLWNKKDNVYDHAAKVKAASKVTKSFGDIAYDLGSNYLKGKTDNYRSLVKRKPKGILGDPRFLSGLQIGTAATFSGLALTPVIGAMLNRPGPDEYKRGIKKTMGKKNDYRTLKELDRRAAVQRSKQRKAGGVASAAFVPAGLAYGYSDNVFDSTNKYAGTVARVARQTKGKPHKAIKPLLQAARYNPAGAAVLGGAAVGAGALGKWGYHRAREGAINTRADVRRQQRYRAQVRKGMESAFVRVEKSEKRYPNVTTADRVVAVIPAAGAVRSASRSEKGKRASGFLKPMGAAAAGVALGNVVGAKMKAPFAPQLLGNTGAIVGSALGVNSASKNYMEDGNRKLLLRQGYLNDRVKKSAFVRD